MSDWYTLDADGNPVEAERDSDAMAFWKANKRGVRNLHQP